jgi:hypothetical protein
VAVRGADAEDLGPDGPGESSEAGRANVGSVGGCHTEVPMRSLVTGAAGVVGSHLSRRLVADGLSAVAAP